MFGFGQYLSEIQEAVGQISAEAIQKTINTLQEARLSGHQVFIMGNGGSASTASHFVCDLAKRTRLPGWPSFRVIGLTDNTAFLSALANDEGYETVFSRQLENLVQPFDVVIGISGSGNSPNVLNGIELARSRGAKTIGFTGLTGGKLKDLVQISVHTPTVRIDQAEDIHLMLEHFITDTLATQAETITPEKTVEPGWGRMDEVGMGLVRQLFGESLQMADSTRHPDDCSERSPESLSQISQEFAKKLNLHNLLTRILSLTVDYIGAASGSIVVLDNAGEVIDGASSFGGKVSSLDTVKYNETVQHGLAGWVLENRKPAIVVNTKDDPRWLRRMWETSRSAVCIPLMTMNRVIGVLTLTRLETQQFNMEDLSLLSAIALTLSYSVGLNQMSSN